MSQHSHLLGLLQKYHEIFIALNFTQSIRESDKIIVCIYFYLFLPFFFFFWSSSLSPTSRFALCTSHKFTDVSSPLHFFLTNPSLLMFSAVLLRLASVFGDLKHLFHPFKLHQLPAVYWLHAIKKKPGTNQFRKSFIVLLYLSLTMPYHVNLGIFFQTFYFKHYF